MTNTLRMMWVLAFTTSLGCSDASFEATGSSESNDALSIDAVGGSMAATYGGMGGSEIVYGAASVVEDIPEVVGDTEGETAEAQTAGTSDGEITTTILKATAQGTCCAGGDCLCHGDPPLNITTFGGPYWTDTIFGSTGTIYYPTNADPPFAGISLCGGFLNMGPEMVSWGSFYASWGIVTVITSTLPTDFPDIRGIKLLASLDELKDQNNNPLSPLFGKMSGRYGTSGYSMGGGGSTIASIADPSLKSSVAMAPWGDSIGMRVPTLFLCGDIDFIAGVSTPSVSFGTPSLLATVGMAGHLSWFGPTDATANFALAWQKVYLEGDERWKTFLSRQPLGITSVRPNNL